MLYNKRGYYLFPSPRWIGWLTMDLGKSLYWIDLYNLLVLNELIPTRDVALYMNRICHWFLQFTIKSQLHNFHIHKNLFNQTCAHVSLATRKSCKCQKERVNKKDILLLKHYFYTSNSQSVHSQNLTPSTSQIVTNDIF